MTEAVWDVLRAFDALSPAEQQQVAAEILSRSIATDERPKTVAAERGGDEPEFTDEQLRAAIKRVGLDARQEAFAAGRPVFIIKGRSLVALHADGTEEVIKTLHLPTETVQGRE